MTVLGDDVDVEIVELLTTSLLVQATRAMLGVDARSASEMSPVRHSVGS